MAQMHESPSDTKMDRRMTYFPNRYVLAAADAAVERVHARDQLGRGEGLCDIVVRAGHKAGDLVHLLALGAEHEDAHLRAGRADAAADLKAVDVRQHHVEQSDERVRILLELFERFLACGRLDRLVTGPAQVDDDEAADAGLVLKYENFLHVICILSKGGVWAPLRFVASAFRESRRFAEIFISV